MRHAVTGVGSELTCTLLPQVSDLDPEVRRRVAVRVSERLLELLPYELELERQLLMTGAALGGEAHSLRTHSPTRTFFYLMIFFIHFESPHSPVCREGAAEHVPR